MIKKLEQTHITVRKSEVIVIRQPPGITLTHCLQCSRPAEMLSAEQVVTLTGISSLKLFKLVVSGQVHFRETAKGHLLICLESLRAGSR